MKIPILVLFLIVAGCERRTPTAPARSLLTVQERSELHLPQVNQLTLATQTDVDYVKTLGKEVHDTTVMFLESRHQRFSIVAARPVSRYLLLWISFPDVVDGGIDLIYSIGKRAIVGEFNGAMRG